MNHWEDMAAKETAVKAAKSELREEKARHQSTRQSLESNLQPHDSAIAKTQYSLNENGKQLAKIEQESSSQLQAAEQQNRSQEKRCKALDSSLAAKSHDLSLLQDKYDRLKTEAMHHWKYMSAKDKGVKDTRSELQDARRAFSEEEAKHQTTKASLEAKLQASNDARASNGRQLDEARQELSSLEQAKEQLVERIDKAKREAEASKQASVSDAQRSQAEMARINEELSKIKTTSSTLQQEKEHLLERVRDAGIAGEQSKEQLDAAQQLVNHYRSAYEELVATVLPGKHPEDMSAQELTQSLRNGIAAVHELQAAGTDAMLEAKEVIESTKLQRDRLTALLNDIFPTYVQTLALCERMMMYWRSGITTAAAASRTRLEEDASETSSKSEMEDENGMDNDL